MHQCGGIGMNELVGNIIKFAMTDDLAAQVNRTGQGKALMKLEGTQIFRIMKGILLSHYYPLPPYWTQNWFSNYLKF